jgi:hypothetical protein
VTTSRLTQDPGHILILGPSKTGTTGLYSAVKRGLSDAGIRARTLFEPPSPDLIDNLHRYAPSVPVMAKVTMDKLDHVVPDLGVFDRRVMTVRDPRDVVISALLFRPLTVGAIQRAKESSIQRFIAALEEKEADPSSHSVRSLFALAQRLGIGRRPYPGMATIMDRQRALLDSGTVHVMRYERFVQGDLDDLSKFLGFDVVNTAALDSGWIGHITRSQSHGEFTRWFRDDDLSYFNGLFDKYLRAFDYELDVPLASESKIDPATSSEYVRRRYFERRAKLAELNPTTWKPQDVSSAEAFNLLTERAQDGDPQACLRAAKVLLSGHLGEVDTESALDWARFAAQLGAVDGMLLTVELLRRLDPEDPGLRRELRTWALETESDGGRRLASLHAEVRRLRGSRRYRIGSALAEAADHPLRAVPRALKLASGALARRIRR